ncbi:hypothetical protein, partial [Shigella sonnei]|uniref:hypothetical protein n=1 Tax=Shigella sonnei TaxID=624 RepID=UPI001C0A6DBD
YFVIVCFFYLSGDLQTLYPLDRWQRQICIRVSTKSVSWQHHLCVLQKRTSGKSYHSDNSGSGGGSSGGGFSGGGGSSGGGGASGRW